MLEEGSKRRGLGKHKLAFSRNRDLLAVLPWLDSRRTYFPANHPGLTSVLADNQINPQVAECFTKLFAVPVVGKQAVLREDILPAIDHKYGLMGGVSRQSCSLRCDDMPFEAPRRAAKLMVIFDARKWRSIHWLGSFKVCSWTVF